MPLERLARLMKPLTMLINEQPLDSLDIPPIRYELQGYDSWYASMDRRGGEHFCSCCCMATRWQRCATLAGTPALPTVSTSN